jgi:hypothetical protein
MNVLIHGTTLKFGLIKNKAEATSGASVESDIEGGVNLEKKEKKYVGYGYHGGGRPKAKVKVKYQTISIAGHPEEIEKLKEKAREANKTVSAYVLDILIRN